MTTAAPEKRRRNGQAVSWVFLAASREKTWPRLPASLLGRETTTMRNASIADGNIGQIVVLLTVRMMMMHAPLFQAVADARRGAEAVAVSEDMETGRMLMMKRYIALLICDSAGFRNVFRMNVDVVCYRIVHKLEPPPHMPMNQNNNHSLF